MDIVPVSSKALVLDKMELHKLVQCLAYCNHRLTSHKNTGLERAGVNREFIVYAINTLSDYANEERRYYGKRV
jgi:hypothetical protein